MASKKKLAPKRKYFTVGEANAALPLVGAIVKDIADLAGDLRDRHERLSRVVVPQRGSMSQAHSEELLQVQSEFERGQERMREFEHELKSLGVELKDYYTGLIDFPCWMDGHEVYLCWRLGEADVAHWHELESGFSGRQKLKVGAITN